MTPRFDALLRSLAGENIDIRLTEARVSALVSACWSLLVPFYLLNPKFKEVFGGVLKEMQVSTRIMQAQSSSGLSAAESLNSSLLVQVHQQVLQMAVEQAEQRGQYQVATPSTSQQGPRKPPDEDRTAPMRTTIVQTALVEPSTSSQPSAPTSVVVEKKPEQNGVTTAATTKLKRPPDEDERRELLNDEAPADPSIS